MGKEMKKINLCGNLGIDCPKLMVTRAKKLKYHIVDDYGGLVRLTEDEARNLALAIFKEVGER
jgi:hypothetical protein